jgi:23S rRNA (cytidine2498-2'-O)-methyltransferase
MNSEPVKMLPVCERAYLAAEGYEEQLAKEIGNSHVSYGRLFLSDCTASDVYWAQNIWYRPFKASFNSIGEAAALLRSIQRNWVHYPHTEHRRAALIQEKLPYLSDKPLRFPSSIPTTPLGSWTLLDKNTLLASTHCSSPYRHGQPCFEECKEGPPSRAYLKLWEALTLAGKMPTIGGRCLEIGASPGGWTWVLARLGAEVICVDRAPLAPEVAVLPGVHFKTGNAFAMTPEAIGPVDWIFSDVACYPEKLLEWVKLWLTSGMCQQFICTLKFQGDVSYDIVNEFANIPGSRVMHLGYNKHELTWIRLPV